MLEQMTEDLCINTIKLEYLKSFALIGDYIASSQNICDNPSNDFVLSF